MRSKCSGQAKAPAPPTLAIARAALVGQPLPPAHRACRLPSSDHLDLDVAELHRRLAFARENDLPAGSACAVHICGLREIHVRDHVITPDVDAETVPAIRILNPR